MCSQVFYTEMMKSRPASPAVTVDLPQNLDTLTTVRLLPHHLHTVSTLTPISLQAVLSSASIQITLSLKDIDEKLIYLRHLADLSLRLYDMPTV